jgi:hypothetical protein
LAVFVHSLAVAPKTPDASVYRVIAVCHLHLRFRRSYTETAQSARRLAASYPALASRIPLLAVSFPRKGLCRSTFGSA